MTTDESSAQKRATNPKDGDGGGDRDNWVMDFGRGLGFVARSFVDGLDLLWQRVDAEVAGPGVHRGESGGSRDLERERLDKLLQQLGEVVSAHADRGYPTLAEDEEFGGLLTQLYFAWQRAKRGRRLGEILARRRTKDAVSDPAGSSPPRPLRDAPKDQVLEEVAAPSMTEEEDPLAGVLEDAVFEASPDEKNEEKKDEKKNEKRGKAGKKQD